MRLTHFGKTLRFSLLLTGLVLGRAAHAAFGQETPYDEDVAKISRTSAFKALAEEVATLEKQSNVLKKVVKLVQPTVVHIEAEKTDQNSVHFGHRSQVEEAGSGFVIKLANQYYVVTNRHVIKNAAMRDIKITLADGRLVNPTKAWSDPETDIAVMAVNASHLIASRLGSSDEMEIGDFVLAVGSPFGLSHSVTFGIISAKGRRDLELGDDVRFQDFMQTDAAINPGNSGGPLISLRGEVIGMNTAIASSSGGNEGIGFTIPVNMVMAVVRQLVDHGSVVRAYLGVTLDRKFGPAMATTVGLQRPRGARVNLITPGSPAELAKLLPGDVILEYDRTRIENDSHLISMVSLTPVGKEVALVVFRDHKFVNLSVKVSTSPATTRTGSR